MKYSTDFSHAGLFRPRLLEEGGGGIRMQRVLSVTKVSAEARGRVVWFVHAQGLLDLSKHSSSSFAAGWFSFTAKYQSHISLICLHRSSTLCVGPKHFGIWKTRHSPKLRKASYHRESWGAVGSRQLNFAWPINMKKELFYFALIGGGVQRTMLPSGT